LAGAAQVELIVCLERDLGQKRHGHQHE
jgi:hypothetical protein